jgi:hypothetical protein
VIVFPSHSVVAVEREFLNKQILVKTPRILFNAMFKNKRDETSNMKEAA